jgi:hypothetical protein
MSDALPRVAFVHVPRTAGTAFGRMLESVYAGRPTANFYADADEPIVNARIERFRRLDAVAKNDVALLKGHFVRGFDPALGAVRYVTLLREPLPRLVSYYFYALREGAHYLHAYLMQRRLGLEAFLASDASIDLDNYQVRAISGCRFASARERVEQVHCDEAKRQLEHGFAAFGLTERFDESLALIARTIGWRLPPSIRANAGSYDPALVISEQCRERFLHKNRFDVELLAFARELLERRLAA